VTTLENNGNGPDYNRIACTYDESRQPGGLELILRAFDASSAPLPNMHVLDAGCGTGSYSLALADHVGSVVGIDRSQGMIARAREKMHETTGQAPLSFTVGTMAEMPFGNAAFDAIMVNQALHHLGDGRADGFPAHEKAVREFARTLKPDGVIVASTSSQEQCLQGFWFYNLIPEAARRLQKRFMPLPELARLLRKLGFRHVKQQILPTMVLQGDAYFDARGPLRDAWRNGDSAWSLATLGELEKALSTIRELDRLGQLEATMREWDAPRQRMGQVTFLYASRCPFPSEVS